MKNLITVLGFLMIPFLASASYSLDDGKYFNHSINKKVKINCTANHIKAKGLINYDWVKFRSCGNREFVDRRGNMIRVVGHNTFEFIARNRRRAAVFHRDNLVDRLQHEYTGVDHRSCNSYCGSGCTYHGSSHGSHQDYDDYNGSSSYSTYDSLEGLWETSGYEKDVIIELTRDGLRAKFLGSNRDWTYYSKDQYDRNEYVDNRGNRYVVRTARELVWYPKQGGSPIKLRRAN